MPRLLRRAAAVVITAIVISGLIASNGEARKIDKAGMRVRQALSENENPTFIDQGMRDLQTSAAVDTYCLVWYDFEQLNWQGWNSIDNTAQIDTFWHVDDFAGLGGGAYGRLAAIEGSKSMWCGTRPAGDARAKADFEYLCSWGYAPGYGNSWNQMLSTQSFPVTGVLNFSYHGVFDSEPDFDKTLIEYDSGDDNWVEIAMYDGTVDTVATHQLLLSQIATKLRFHFISDGAWSDQDGLWNTDGAAIIDDITVTDNTGTINSENWEGEALDALRSDNWFWRARVEDAFGSYVGLANNLVEDDPCGDNFASQIIFYNGSSQPGPDYPWPGMFVTPYCKGAGGLEAPCQDEMVISPVIDLTRYSSSCDENQDTPIPPASLPDLGGVILRYTTYYDLPLENLVFTTWAVRSIDGTGCPGVWQDSGLNHYINYDSYVQSYYDISTLVESDHIQVSLGVVDMCDAWFDAYGDCAEHTPSPWYDNVRLYAYDSSGPQWSVRGLDLFQDNFPSEEFNIESWVRIDAANDLRANDDPIIDPGDSAVVTCSAPTAGGLDTLATGEERVYCHVWAEYIGEDELKPDLYGPALEGNYGTYVSDDGLQWTIFLMPNARNSWGQVQEDQYMIDLNDSLFTRGYEIKYYFRAYDLAGGTNTHPENAGTGGWMYEVTCLPTLNSEYLFVDDYHGRGTDDGTVQVYWQKPFKDIIYGPEPDRYDVNSPSSLVGNGPGSRAYNYMLTNSYEIIIWDSGNLSYGTITEGTSHSDKSNDAQMLIDWIELSEHKVGLWVMGDDVAADLAASPATSALMLLSTYCGVSLADDSYFELTGGWDGGGVPSPLVAGVSGGIYDGIVYYLFGGCPVLNSFDVLETSGYGDYSLQLPDYNSTNYYIGVSNSSTNAGAYPLRTSWIGHSMMYVRNGGLQIARNELFYTTWEFFENPVDEDCHCADSSTPECSHLTQNYPNPFNPATTISYGLAAKGEVSLKIYNVAGQLVRTLVSGELDAGMYKEVWDGRSDSGSKVASGIYFYRLTAPDFEQSKKMVMLR